jgi:hypothetical protein
MSISTRSVPFPGADVQVELTGTLCAQIVRRHRRCLVRSFWSKINGASKLLRAHVFAPIANFVSSRKNLIQIMHHV